VATDRLVHLPEAGLGRLLSHQQTTNPTPASRPATGPTRLDHHRSTGHPAADAAAPGTPAASRRTHQRDASPATASRPSPRVPQDAPRRLPAPPPPAAPATPRPRNLR
jgi:hypothetical protein